MMDIIPAIDLKGGKCVRLLQGRDEATTEYSADPVATAREWVRQGARRLHVVNLDGAFGRKSRNLEVLDGIITATDAAVQFGGGLRSRESIDRVLKAGASKVVLGTIAVENPALLSECLAAYGPRRIIVAIDTLGGKVVTRGWTTVTDADIMETARQLYAAGTIEILQTDVARDGMMTGPDISTIAQLSDIGLSVLASGGISSEQDVRALLLLAKPNLTGVIIGKALYENAVSLSSLVAMSGNIA